MNKGSRVRNIVNGQIGHVVWFASRVKVRYDNGAIDSVPWEHLEILYSR